MLLHKETDLVERILTECEDDYVGLWSILRQVRDASYPQPELVTLALLRYLLSTRTVEAGTPDSQGGFQAWKAEPDEIVSQIAAEWSKLGGEPTIGDIVWFTTPIRASRPS